MQERISIENFGGIKKADIDLNKINIFIGPQASGKSIIAKLIYYFKDISQKVLNEDTNSVFSISDKTFDVFFPEDFLGSEYYEIEYCVGSDRFTKTSNSLMFPPSYKDFMRQRETNKIRTSNESLHPVSLKPQSLYFIPAGRVLFSSIQSNFYAFTKYANLDPFFKEFGIVFQNIKRKKYSVGLNKSFDEVASKILIGEFETEHDEDYLKHPDGRKINMLNTSSGQQESTPLVLILKEIILNKDIRDVAVFIEEPEAHLFPTAQKQMIELIAMAFNTDKKRNIQFVITTHSPYILTSFNNLIQAGQIAETLPEASLQNLYKVVSQSQHLHIKDIAAYSVANGGVKSIIDKENSLIDASLIDQVSNDIAIQFDQLLDLQ